MQKNGKQYAYDTTFSLVLFESRDAGPEKNIVTTERALQGNIARSAANQSARTIVAM